MISASDRSLAEAACYALKFYAIHALAASP